MRVSAYWGLGAGGCVGSSGFGVHENRLLLLPGVWWSPLPRVLSACPAKTAGILPSQSVRRPLSRRPEQYLLQTQP